MNMQPIIKQSQKRFESLNKAEKTLKETLFTCEDGNKWLKISGWTIYKNQELIDTVHPRQINLLNKLIINYLNSIIEAKFTVVG